MPKGKAARTGCGRPHAFVDCPGHGAHCATGERRRSLPQNLRRAGPGRRPPCAIKRRFQGRPRLEHIALRMVAWPPRQRAMPRPGRWAIARRQRRGALRRSETARRARVRPSCRCARSSGVVPDESRNALPGRNREGLDPRLDFGRAAASDLPQPNGGDEWRAPVALARIDHELRVSRAHDVNRRRRKNTI
jgi:hypothetical protein